jgi:hypothetical protein
MRAGRFGSKAGRVAVVVALVLGTLVAGTTAAGAAELSSVGTSASTIGQVAQTTSDQLAQTYEVDWG